MKQDMLSALRNDAQLRSWKSEPLSLPATESHLTSLMRAEDMEQLLDGASERDVAWYFDEEGLPIVHRILNRICNQRFSLHTQWGLSRTSERTPLVVSDSEPAQALHRTKSEDSIASDDSVTSQGSDDSALHASSERPMSFRTHFVPMVPQALLPRGVLDILVERVTELCREEPNIVDISQPVTIFGDLHGQFVDLLSAVHHSKDLDASGALRASQHWLFLGDYVDRGCHAIEILAYLFALKIRHPKQVFLLRGNHESRAMTFKSYVEGISFSQECIVKYSKSLYVDMMRCFDTMPLAAVITVGREAMDVGALMETEAQGLIRENVHQDVPPHGDESDNSKQLRFFCSHAGISPGGKTIAQLQAIDRFREPPLAGPFCDLVWSDPLPETGVKVLSEKDLDAFMRIKFQRNEVRGCSWMVGYELVREFLERNDLAGVIRGHQVAKSGVSFHFSRARDGSSLQYPMYTTVFSAPNYCGQYSNRGAILKINDRGDYLVYKYTRPADSPQRASLAEATDAFADREPEFGSEQWMSDTSFERELREELHPGMLSLRASVRNLVFIVRKSAANQSALESERSELKVDADVEESSGGGSLTRRPLSRQLSIQAFDELSSAVSPDDREQLRYVFAALDRNNDGFLGPDERDELLTLFRSMVDDDGEDETRAFLECLENSETRLISF
eukprot:CAMPEP_0185835206 /NCGR_PEP_ID=MMETSP1353-20130828/7262_1 /TAXON_ID=1077150 /ORGANISM="Erythrolobus australicus, Strain CCMP3124" /LENGTH=677 /DNA_ID=CAMNT_0028533789 /DNA_START=45 /DNA_END=2075 /DNA_ORIENTATION=+